MDIKLEEVVQLMYHFYITTLFNVNYMLYKCNQSVIDASLIDKKKQQ